MEGRGRGKGQGEERARARDKREGEGREGGFPVNIDPISKFIYPQSKYRIFNYVYIEVLGITYEYIHWTLR